MLVGKGKFKYSEDLEDIRHLGSGADDRFHILQGHAGTARDITHPRSTKGKHPHTQLSEVMATQRALSSHTISPLTHPGSHCHLPQLGREENPSAFQDHLFFFLPADLQAGFLKKNSTFPI